tara:strand:- start:5297 stop:5899 length:603 start_codon:yes stop_codon:yes gene_type:complete
MCVDPITAIAGMKAAFATVGTALSGGAAAGGAAAASGLAGSIGTIATVGGGVISAYSQYQNGKAAAEVAGRNAAAQDRAAVQAIEAGDDASDRKRAAAAAMSAQNKASAAANGLDVTSGQALEVLDDNNALMTEDAFAIRENARRGAGNLAQSAANSRADASSSRFSSFTKPIGTALGTAAKVGSRYASWAGQQVVPGAY